MPLIKKRSLLWDWTNTRSCPHQITKINFSGPISSLSNWNTWTPPELPPNIPFRPTIRTLSQISSPDSEDWTNILSSSTKPGTIIYYLNEPDRSGDSPQAAIDAYLSHLLPLRKEKGVKVVGPACASDPAGEKWLDQFMTLLATKGEEVDFLGLHYYGEDLEECKKWLNKMHEMYPRTKVVVNEIACTSRDYEVVKGFTIGICNWMDEQEWVFEYALFGCMMELADGFVSPEAQLMDKKEELRELMVSYMDEQPMRV